MLDTNVIVAPNSPSPRANDSNVPVTMPGSASGSVIEKSTQSRDAPSVRAATSSLRSIASIDRRIARTISGKPMTADASAAPVHRNASTTPNHRSSQLPIGPCLPKSTSSAKPTTTGGSTSGKWTIASTAVLPGNVKRARPNATSTATGRLHSTLKPATFRLSVRISISLAVGAIIGLLLRGLEAVLRPRAARRGGLQVIEKRLGRRRLARGDYGGRVDDRRMARFR